MNNRLFSVSALVLVLLPILTYSRVPTVKGMKTFRIQYEFGVKDGIIYLGDPTVSIDGKQIECHCGRRATNMAIVNNEVVGLCLKHESCYENHSCIQCGSLAGSPNESDLKIETLGDKVKAAKSEEERKKALKEFDEQTVKDGKKVDEFFKKIEKTK